MPALVRQQLMTAGYQRVGLLATAGTLASRLYPSLLEPDIMVLEADAADKVHDAIYHPALGLKAVGVTAWAERQVVNAARALCAADCQVIVLACTELGLLAPALMQQGIEVTDAMDCLIEGMLKPEPR